VFTAAESTLSVFGPVWLLGVAQQRLNWSFRWARPVISRSSYGAFMLQGLALIVLAIALRPLPLHAEVKRSSWQPAVLWAHSPSPGFSSAESPGEARPLTDHMTLHPQRSPECGLRSFQKPKSMPDPTTPAQRKLGRRHRCLTWLAPSVPCDTDR
jgi:hypothetical protein